MAETVDSTALFQGYKAFYDCHDLSDLTIVCGERKWKVHKLVMSANSTFFRKACTGEFKEAKANTIELKEDDEHAVAMMIYYLYHGTYNVKDAKDVSWPVLHLHVYQTGDKYAVNGLAKLAKARLFFWLDKCWDKDGFADAIEATYSTDLPDNHIRGKFLAVTKLHYQELFADGPNYDKFKQVARSTPDFCFELVQAIGGISPQAWVGARVMETTSATSFKAVELLTDEEADEEADFVQALIDSLDKDAHDYSGRRTQLEGRKVALNRRMFGRRPPMLVGYREDMEMLELRRESIGKPGT